MSLFDNNNKSFFICCLEFGCIQFLLSSNRGNKTKFLLCIKGWGKKMPLFINLFAKSKISISQTLGAFFIDFVLPSIVSIFLHFFNNSSGAKLVDISKTILKNFGLFGLGHDKLS